MVFRGSATSEETHQAAAEFASNAVIDGLDDVGFAQVLPLSGKHEPSNQRTAVFAVTPGAFFVKSSDMRTFFTDVDAARQAIVLLAEICRAQGPPGLARHHSQLTDRRRCGG